MQKEFATLVAKAWKDEIFKERLLTAPKAALSEHGIPVPEGVQVEVVENTNTKIYFVLPRNPASLGELPGGLDDTIGVCNTCGTSLPCATY